MFRSLDYPGFDIDLVQKLEDVIGENAGKPPNLQPMMLPGLIWLKLLASVGIFVVLAACGGGVATRVPSTTAGMGQFLQAGPISPQVTLERALAATKEQLSYYYTIENKTETTRGGVRWDADSVTVGKFRAPDRFEAKVSTTFATSNETVTGGGESITIGATEYTKTPETGEWEVHTREPAVPVKTPLERMIGDPSLLSSLAFVAVEQLDGVDVLHLIAIVPPGVDIVGLFDPRLDRRVEYWIGRDDLLIRKHFFSGESPDEEGFTFTITMSNFGEPVEINAPEAFSPAIPKP